MTLRFTAIFAFGAVLVSLPAPSGAEKLSLTSEQVSQGPRGLELGVFGGLFVPNEDHEFFNFRETTQVPLNDIGPDLGVRIGYFPIAFAGVEVEADLLPFGTEGAGSALLYGLRAQLVTRPLAGRFRPLALLGLGIMGVRSDKAGLSDDTDAVGHLGLGVETDLGKRVTLRFDGRYLRAPAAGSDSGTNHFAALLGVAVNLGPQSSAAASITQTQQAGTLDSDGDGVPDSRDACANLAGDLEDGCPPPDTDVDGDGFGTASDKCPEQPETVNGIKDDDGCPESPSELAMATDSDGDGLMDATDACPGQQGPAENAGCPDRDADGDTVFDRLDNCPQKAGRPDFAGCNRAQSVQLGSRTITLSDPVEFAGNGVAQRSRQVLANLAEVLVAHPELQIVELLVRAPNAATAEARAKALRKHLLDRGVKPEQLEVAGEASSDGGSTVEVFIVEGLMRGDEAL